MAEIDPDVLKNLKDLDALVDENGKISQENSSRFNELKNKIGELQQDKKPENRLEIVTGSDGTLELRKGEEPVLPDGKAYGKFVSDFKNTTLGTFKGGDMTEGPIKASCDAAGKSFSQALIGSDALAGVFSDSYRRNLQPDLEQQANSGFEPSAAKDVSNSQVESLPAEVQTPEQAQKNMENLLVQLVENQTSLQKSIERWTEEAKNQRVETNKYIDGKFDELEKRLKDKLPTETQKSTLEKVIETLKFLVALTGIGLGAYLTIAELKKHAQEKSGCFVDYIDSKAKTTTVYKVKQLTCDSDYRNSILSTMQWADESTLSGDCINKPTPPPKPSGCESCYQSLTTNKNCPCPDSDNFVSLFCSDNYLANPDNQSTINHHYHSEKFGLLDSFNDLLAYFVAIAGEIVNDAATGFGDLLKSLFKFIEYGVIIVGVIVLIYIILRVFGIIGGGGGEKEVKIEVETPGKLPTNTTPTVSSRIPQSVSIIPQERSLEGQDPSQLLARIQEGGIAVAASEAGVSNNPPVSNKPSCIK